MYNLEYGYVVNFLRIYFELESSLGIGQVCNKNVKFTVRIHSEIHEFNPIIFQFTRKYLFQISQSVRHRNWITLEVLQWSDISERQIASVHASRH